MRCADLHLHTLFSDGTYSPEELAHHAAEQGLATIALTDHDTLEGCARAAAACQQLGIGFLPGTEFTAELRGAELHLLGYCLDPEHTRLLAAMQKFQESRQQRIHDIVGRLNQLEIPLQVEAVFNLAKCRSPGRPHVARVLVAQGFCSSVDQAFERFLKRDRPAWAPKFRMAAPEAIRLIHDAGGVAVLAHPGLNRIDARIPELVDSGLDGIECFHTKHPPAVAQHYLALARKHRLLVTGGSDCHGLAKGQPLIGSVRIPHDCVDLLIDAAVRRRASSPAAPAAVLPPETSHGII
jgi:hypothetical protein